MTSWKTAVRDWRYWAIMAFILLVRVVPLAIGIGVAFAVGPYVGRGLVALLSVAVFLGLTYLIRRFAFERLWIAFARRVLYSSDA